MTTTLAIQRPRLVPQAGPAAWLAADLAPSDWMIPLGAEDAAEIDAALAALGGRRPERAEEVALPRLAPLLADLRARLEHGRGFALLRGLPLDRYGTEGAEALLLALGVHLGMPLPADAAAGGAVAHLVTPAAADIAALAGGSPRFHADPCDAVALLCLRQPPATCASVLVAAAAAHNAMMRRDRALLEELHRPLPQAGGAEPRPVFSHAGGMFCARYDRGAIEAGGAPLSEAQHAALDLLDAVCAEPGLPLRVETRPGDLLCFNPHLVWKRRVLVEAAAPATPDAAAAPREFLRLRLLTENSRTAAAAAA